MAIVRVHLHLVVPAKAGTYAELAGAAGRLRLGGGIGSRLRGNDGFEGNG